MIIALFGVSGVGKSFLCDEISRKLEFKKFHKIKVRERRPEEKNCSDVLIANENLLKTLREEGKIALEFDLFGNSYAFLKQDLDSQENMVFEMNYLFFDTLKNLRPDIFTIYLLPNDLDQAIQKVKNRNLKKQEEEIRIEEAHKEFIFVQENELFLKKFNIVATNTYEYSFGNAVIGDIKKLQ
ncbi:MAG: hypothetical protein LBD32_02595 [Cytophagales bacterium]|jgi:guanylate kinase|nr:hypothetical protein [Cytophagales bacterium]